MLSSPASSSAYAVNTTSADLPNEILPFFSRPSVSERRGLARSAVPVDIGLTAIDEESVSASPAKSRKVSTADYDHELEGEPPGTADLLALRRRYSGDGRESESVAVLAVAASLAMAAQAQAQGQPGTLPLQTLLEARSLQTLAAAVSKTLPVSTSCDVAPVSVGTTASVGITANTTLGEVEGQDTMAEETEEGAEPALDSTAQELEEALQRTTDLVAQSVHGILKNRQAAGGARVLVFGKDSFFRAKYLSSTKSYFASPLHVLRDAKATVSDGLFWSEDAESLAVCQPATFDVILCFNLTGTAREDVATVVKDLERTLRPGGCFVGTGVFKGCATDMSPDAPRVDLREFRQCVEEHGFYMHTAIDMSLEGNIILKVASDLEVQSNMNNAETAQEDHPLEMVRSGQLVCARFLATKDLQPGAATLAKQVVSVATSAEGSRIVGRKISDADLARPLSHHTSPKETVVAETGSLVALAANRLAAASAVPTTMSVTTTLSCPSPLPVSIAAAVSPVRQAPLARQASPVVSAPPVPKEGIVVTGISLGLPNAQYPDRPVFDPRNFDYLFRGDNCISYLTPEEKGSILGQNIVQVSKKEGKRVEHVVRNDKDCVQVASKIGKFDLAKEYGVPGVIVETLDTTYQLAIAAGLEALRDAGIPIDLLKRGPTGKPVGLPEDMQEDTGVIFASSFPGLDSCVEEVTKCVAAKAKRELIEDLKLSLSAYLPFQFGPAAQAAEGQGEASKGGKAQESRHAVSYQYNRKLLFRLLVMANAQLAELINARGPNTQCNSACSGTTQAIAIAEDWIRSGRCRRVIVIAADNATSDLLLPYLATGFLALGAASTAPTIEEAAVPFDKRRKGMILGAGACALVLETTSKAIARSAPIKSELLGSWVKNSAFHACLMDKEHIAVEMKKFIDKLEGEGLDRAEVARSCIYFSHETGTSANGGCAQVETDALLRAFGEAGKKEILIANTKGFTGHPMGVGMEDVVAVASLAQGFVPPVANHRITDPCLGSINLSRGGAHDKQYVLRLAAGFGSQFTILLMRKWTSESAQKYAAIPLPLPLSARPAPALEYKAVRQQREVQQSQPRQEQQQQIPRVSIGSPSAVSAPVSIPSRAPSSASASASPSSFSPVSESSSISVSPFSSFLGYAGLSSPTQQARVRQRAFMTID